MDVTIFEYLLALAETGSLTGAAKKFFISPSALSQRLSREEQELNCILFQRKGGRFIPTKEGEIYLKYAREALQVRDDTYLQLKRLVSGRPSLIIASSHPLFQEAAGRILPKLRPFSRNPGLICFPQIPRPCASICSMTWRIWDSYVLCPPATACWTRSGWAPTS